VKVVPVEEVQLAPSLEIKDKSEYDIIIVGAGISGISAAHTFMKKNPKKNFVILEGRSALGGTWDLFRYPGIRSDSDMFTLGYSHRPWKKVNPIALGDEIRNYVKSVAKDFGIDKKISYQKEVAKASFSSDTNKWTIQVIDRSTGQPITLTCNVLHMCSGYYDYKNPYTPHFEGQENFKGKIIHPQLWDEKLDYRNKKVVIIGSGATAVTLLPAMADNCKSITMLQRSPSYVLSLPQHSRTIVFLQRVFPSRISFFLIRCHNIAISYLLYVVCRSFPSFAKKTLLGQTKKRLPKDFDVEKHFTPAYNPWDQRLCLAPDGDFFKAIRNGKAFIVTDHIDRFVENGILLKSGETLEADLIVTATGLQVSMFGGAKIVVDGAEVDFSKKVVYRGMMFNDIPNFIYSAGYTNASWTLKCELTSEWTSRILSHMDKVRAKQFCPILKDDKMVIKPMFNLTSGYIDRAMHTMPKQGDKAPWCYNNYPGDLYTYLVGKADDGVLQFK